MILDSGNLQAFSPQNSGSFPDFRQIVVGQADATDLSGFGQGDQLSCPLRRTYRVMNPVDIHVVSPQQFGTGFIQGNDCVLRIGIRALGCNFLLGQEGVDYSYEEFTLATRGQNNDKLVNISSGTRATSWSDVTDDNYAFLSFFARGEYNYADRYYVDFSVRTDGSSRFGTSGRWAAFGSVGMMWNLRNEKFMENSRRWLTNAQIAFSTGTSGNSSIPNYEHMALVSGGLNYYGDAGIAPSQPGNEDLQWEKLWITNLAVHLGFWNRLNVDVELYHKKNSAMLMEVPVSYTTSNGFGFRWDNVGDMTNRGVEVSLAADVIQHKDFVWSVNANVSYNRNKMTKLYSGVSEYELSSTNTKLVVGHSFGEFYLNRFAGVNPANGDALWYTKEGELTTELRDEDKVMVGKSLLAFG